MRTAPTGLFGRQRELRAVEEALKEAEQGFGSAVTIRGGFGCGKTALLDAARHLAQERRFAVLAAGGCFLDRARPLGLAGRLLDGVPPRAAIDAPTLVLVDDVHWADQPSLRWLAARSQRLAAQPVLLLVSVCDGEPSTDPALLDELLAGSAREVCLAGLDTEASAALLGPQPPVADPGFVAACVRLTGGNPLLLKALAELLGTEPVAPTADELAGRALPAVAAAVRVRLRRVSPHALAVARTVALLDADATVDRVADVCDLDPADLAADLDALTRMGLLALTGARLRFAVPVLGNTVAHDAGLAEAQATHARAARVLHAGGAAPDRVATHLVAGGHVEEPWVAAVLRTAARDAAADGRPETAAGYLHRALRERLPDGARAGLRRELGEVQARVDVAAAIPHLRAAVDQCGPGPERDAVVVRLAGLLALTGQDESAAEVLEADAGCLAHRQPYQIEVWLSRAGTARRAVELLDTLAAAAPAGEDPRMLSLLAMREAASGGSRETAAALARRTLATLPAGPDGARAHLRAVTALSHAGYPDEAYRRCAALVSAAAQWQDRPALALARTTRAYVAWQLGRLPVAAEDARCGLELFLASRAGERTGNAAWLVAVLVTVLVDLGGYDAATAVLQRAGLCDEAPQTFGGTALLLARGRLRVATGHPGDGVRDLLACGALVENWEAANPAVAPWRSEAALALSATGSVAEAQHHAAAAVEQARRWGAPGPLAHALRAHALVTGGCREVPVLAEAVATVKDSPARLELAWCLAEYGSALRRAGQLTDARQMLHAALDLAHECGSPVLVECARTRLSASGARRLTPRTGPASLTPAERRVAVLAAAGRTNREIAESLYVHRRTVEIHLTNAYRKLHIDRRDRLAAALSGTAPYASTIDYQ